MTGQHTRNSGRRQAGNGGGKDSSAQADSNNAQQQASGQASRVTLCTQRNGIKYSLLIENHSAGSIQDVFFTYGTTSTRRTT